jgi:hypothetical protein
VHVDTKAGRPSGEQDNGVLQRLAQARQQKQPGLSQQTTAVAAERTSGGNAAGATRATVMAEKMGGAPGSSQPTQPAAIPAPCIDLTADTPPPKSLEERIQSRGVAAAAEQRHPRLQPQQQQPLQQGRVHQSGQGGKGGVVQAVIDLLSSDDEDQGGPGAKIAVKARQLGSNQQQHRPTQPGQQQQLLSPSKRPAGGPPKPGSPAKKALF